MRIGIYGGSFDPVHFGHLILAEQCREQARLDEVVFVPAARHPLKADHAPASFAHRVRMLELALADQPEYRVDTLENDRSGPSYTVDTLAEFHRLLPGAELALLVGSDCLPEFPKWREPRRILELAELVVMERHPWPVVSPEELRLSLKLPPEFALRMRQVDVPLIDLASRAIRRRVSERRSVRFMLPRVIEDYIESNGLYRG